ncbi:MAG: hypothetical protein HS130_12910, partial [Deltaproteobacteria bacterium]|nr:hypothetical protein [Deltaproteobacteria bacterium]
MLLKRWVPVLAFLIALSATFLVWRELSISEKAGLAHHTALKATSVKEAIRDEMGLRVVALAELARRWEAGAGEETKWREWEELLAAERKHGLTAAVFTRFGDGPVFRAGEAVEAVSAHAEGVSVDGGPALSGPVELEDNRKGFVVSVPVRVDGISAGALS